MMYEVFYLFSWKNEKTQDVVVNNYRRTQHNVERKNERPNINQNDVRCKTYSKK